MPIITGVNRMNLRQLVAHRDLKAADGTQELRGTSQEGALKLKPRDERPGWGSGRDAHRSAAWQTIRLTVRNSLEDGVTPPDTHKPLVKRLCELASSREADGHSLAVPALRISSVRLLESRVAAGLEWADRVGVTPGVATTFLLDLSEMPDRERRMAMDVAPQALRLMHGDSKLSGRSAASLALARSTVLTRVRVVSPSVAPPPWQPRRAPFNAAAWLAAPAGRPQPKEGAAHVARALVFASPSHLSQPFGGPFPAASPDKQDPD